MKKLLLCLLAALMLVTFSACNNNEATEPEPVEPPPVTEPEPQEPTEPQGPQLTVSVYHLGLKNELDQNDAQALALSTQLLALLETAAADDNLPAIPADAPNPMMISSSGNALELLYDAPVDLPFEEDGAPVQAQRILYYIPEDNSAGLLYIGGDMYFETPYAAIADAAMQDALSAALVSLVEQAKISADGSTVVVNGIEFAYVRGDNAAELSQSDVQQMLYRSIALYYGAYVGNSESVHKLCTEELGDAVTEALSGRPNDNKLGQDTIANMSSYIIADVFMPETIYAPVLLDDGRYMVNLHLTEFKHLAKGDVQIFFELVEGTPYVAALELIIDRSEAIE